MLFKQKRPSVPRAVRSLMKDNSFLARDLLTSAADKGDFDAARHWLEEIKKTGDDDAMQAVPGDVFRTLMDAAVAATDKSEEQYWIEEAFKSGLAPRRDTVDRYIS